MPISIKRLAQMNEELGPKPIGRPSAEYKAKRSAMERDWMDRNGYIETDTRGNNLTQSAKKELNRSRANASLAFHIECSHLGEYDSNDPKALSLQCDKYFSLCDARKVTPTVAGLSLALGVSQPTFRKWLSGEIQKPAACKEVIDIAMTMLSGTLEAKLTDGGCNPVGAIFLMKNNFGYRDEQTLKMAPTTVETYSKEQLLAEANLLSDDLDQED